MDCDSRAVQFGFVCHPLDMSDLYRFEPGYRRLPLGALRDVRFRSKPVLLGQFDGIRTPNGIRISGLLFSILLLPHEILASRPRILQQRLIEVAELAADTGCVNLGLGSYWSIWGNGGLSLARKSPIPVTSGATLSASATVMTLQQALAVLGRVLPCEQVAVVGATGAIGRLIAILLAREARSLSLVARNDLALRKLAEELRGARVTTSTQLQAGIEGCGVVIFCTSTPGDLSRECSFARGCLVCDVSRPRNFSEVSRACRAALTVIDGGLVVPPGRCRTTFDIRLPKGLVYPCVAETMILAARGVREPFSLGRSIDPARLEQMEQWRRDLGFAISQPLSFGVPLGEGRGISAGSV